MGMLGSLLQTSSCILTPTSIFLNFMTVENNFLACSSQTIRKLEKVVGVVDLHCPCLCIAVEVNWNKERGLNSSKLYLVREIYIRGRGETG